MTEQRAAYKSVAIPYIPCSSFYFECIRRTVAMPVLLQSDAAAPAADRRGRFDILSAAAQFSVAVYTDHLSINGHLPDAYAALADSTPQTWLDELLRLQHRQRCETDQQRPFVGGFIGYFSYEFGRWQQGMPVVAIEIPLAELHYYPWALLQDHGQQCSQLLFQSDCPEELQRRLQEACCSPAGKITTDSDYRPDFSPDVSEADYQAAFETIQRYIQAGDCYQVNYAQRFSAHTKVDAASLYWQLQQTSTAPYSAFFPLQHADASILSFSPERFIRCGADGQLLTQPIKGTVARGSSESLDQQAAERLQQDEKNRAENLMIVDLLRNDFGRVCQHGSVQVDKLFELQSFTNVHHLVSSISGRLAAEKTVADLWRACFPGGSITGAPKRRAMEIIDELEASPRSIYCGSLAYFSNCGGMDSNILIRTVLQQGSQLFCWGGGGIVSDSSCVSEYQESLTKVNRLLHWHTIAQGTIS